MSFDMYAVQRQCERFWEPGISVPFIIDMTRVSIKSQLNGYRMSDRPHNPQDRCALRPCMNN